MSSYFFKFLVKNPSSRLGCMEKGNNEIRTHQFFKAIEWTKLEELEVPPPFTPKIVSFDIIWSYISKHVEQLLFINLSHLNSEAQEGCLQLRQTIHY